MASQQYKGIVVSHTHWDRAWYWPFEQFRVRLVQTVDQVLDILDSDASYRSFTLDGQTVVLEDYLEVRPERRKDIERLVNARRLVIGPWYVLPDLFLVSPESLVRNLMLGMRSARQFGHVMREGYVPDPFGHIRQLPQILAGFGLRSFIFMRGMGENAEELGSEFWWRAPDGSTVLAVYQRDNYGNLACWGFPYEFGDYRYERPDPATAVGNVSKTFESIRAFARTPYLLFNNGIDHLPPQPEVPELIAHVNRTMPDLRLSHGTFSEFVDAVLQSSSAPSFRTYTGELTGNAHHLILLSVYSARMYLKTANAACQQLLERYAEPVAALAAAETKLDFTPFVWQAWRELLKNHPHDDICGCGVDEIHRDNVNRFERVRQTGEYVRDEGLQVLARHIDTAAQEGKPILLFNPLGWSRTECVELELLFAPDDPMRKEFTLFDAAGSPVPFAVTGIRPLYRMEILKEGRYEAVTVTALVTVPPAGYATLYVRPKKAKPVPSMVQASVRGMENDLLKVSMHPNGTVTVTDKGTRQVYRDLLLFEDTEDAGDEYTYSWAERSRTFTTRGSRPVITVTERSPLHAVITVTHTMKVPASLSPSRRERSAERTTVTIVSRLTLRAASRRLEVETTVTNRARDHRLRVHVPTGMSTDRSFAGGHFDVVERPHPSAKRPTMKNRFEYYATRHLNDFVSMHDAERGLTLATKGLPEYEVVSGPSGDVLALTLLRCVGQLSRNDYITRHMQAGPQLPTPEAQCLGTYTMECAVIPHAGSWADARSYRDALEFRTPVIGRNVPRMSGTLPAVLSVVTAGEKELVLSALKRTEDRTGYVVRFYNIGDAPVRTMATVYRPLQRADRVTLNEEFAATVPLSSETQFVIEAGPKQVVTYKLTLKN